MRDVNKENALVVFSGGQDSTTCLFWAKKMFKEVSALTFVYGQKHIQEVEAARHIAEIAGVKGDVMDVSFISKLGRNSLTDSSMEMDQEQPVGGVPNTFVPGRNLFFLSIYVPIAPISVARVPKIISGSAPPKKMFEIRHPITTPGTAAGVKKGRTVRHSENLT